MNTPARFGKDISHGEALKLFLLFLARMPLTSKIDTGIIHACVTSEAQIPFAARQKLNSSSRLYGFDPCLAQVIIIVRFVLS